MYCEFHVSTSVLCLCSHTSLMYNLCDRIKTIAKNETKRGSVREQSCSHTSCSLTGFTFLFPHHPYVHVTARILFADPSGRWPAEIVGSNPTRGIDVCLLLVLCVVR